ARRRPHRARVADATRTAGDYRRHNRPEADLRRGVSRHRASTGARRVAGVGGRHAVERLRRRRRSPGARDICNRGHHCHARAHVPGMGGRSPRRLPRLVALRAYSLPRDPHRTLPAKSDAVSHFIPRLFYNFMVGTNLSELGISAGEDTRDLATGGSLWWMPTSGEFGPRGGFGDYEGHENVATRFGFSTVRSREDRFSQQSSTPENTTIRM